MSRAFVKEDAGGPEPRRRYPLPPRDDPGWPAAAAGDDRMEQLAGRYLRKAGVRVDGPE